MAEIEVRPHPSIGRVVHYSYDGLRCAATITKVHSATCVNLHVLDQNGESLCAVEEAVYAEDKPWHSPSGAVDLNKTAAPDDTWSWPPRL